MQRFLVLFFGSWLATFGFAFANDEVRRDVIPTPTTAALTAIQEEDLSQFKTAKELLENYIRKYSEQSKEIWKAHLPIEKKWAPYIPLANRYLAEFEKRFPHDPLLWDMRYKKYCAVHNAVVWGKDSSLNPLLTKEELVLQKIIDAPDAGEQVKQWAFEDLLQDKGDEINIESLGDYQKWTEWVSAKCATYPNLATEIHWEIEELRAQYCRFFDKQKALAICDEILTKADKRKDVIAYAAADSLRGYLREEIDAEKRAKVIADKYKKEPLEIQATAVDGGDVDLAKLRGKVVLIDFWGTHCGPCLMAMPELAKTYAALHDKGFEIVGIGGASNQAELAKMIKARKIAGTQVFDADGKFAKQCGIFTGIPRVWILNKQGLVVSDELGYDEGKDDSAHLIPRIEKLLAE